MSTPPGISVIVPVWNDAPRLRRTLEALARQSLPPDAFEIVVVDNGSSDDSGDVARSFPGVRVLVELRKGPAAARNTGLKEATGAIVAFTDADCLPVPRWLEEARAVLLSDETIGIVAGHIEFVVPEGANLACANYDRFLQMDQERFAQIGRSVTANWMSPRALVLEAGGFNETKFAMEDFDLARRITSMGYRVAYAREAVVRTGVRSSLAQVVRRHRRDLGGMWQEQKNSLLKMPLLALKETKWTGQRLVRLFRRDNSLRERIEVATLVAGLWAIGLVELVRLQLGFGPRRT